MNALANKTRRLGQRVTNLKADNEALRARVKALEDALREARDHVAENLSHVGRQKDIDYFTALVATIDKLLDPTP